jgi:2-dehydro-3-deoxyphosphooctonate aldolase (KDO 8-P synthase)
MQKNIRKLMPTSQIVLPVYFIYICSNPHSMKLENIPQLKHLNSNNFFLLAGPCAIEGEEMALRIAERVVEITNKLEIPYVFKGSFKKANRSRIDSFTGIGDEKALKILRKVSETFKIPTITDIHEVSDAAMAAQYVDILQIPAFLVRQTDLVVAAAETGKVVNLKKGQFMSPESMKHAVTKVTDCKNEQVMVTDRGTMFGYQDMIVDFRGIPTMREFAPTVLDVTHSLQQPNQSSGVTGGRPDMIETIARAGIVNHADGLFIETHYDLSVAKSDAANMLDLKYLENLLSNLVAIRRTVNSFN